MMPFYKYWAIRRSTYLLFAFFFFTALSHGQCPDKNFLEKRIAYLRDSKLSPQKQRIELLDYLDKMQNCPYRNDSTHARLAKRIGGVYYQEQDYLNAIKYYRQSINIITANAAKPSVNLTELPGSYYWLAMMYEALNMINEKMKALDSSYKTAIKIHHIDAAGLHALYKWGEYSFDLGDYHRCIDYMQQCGSLAKRYPDRTLLSNREEFISGSLLWQVKALLEIREYQKAEKILSERIEECKNAGLNNNLGTIYSQLAELQLRKHNYDKALLFYNKAFMNDQQVGYNFNCKQTLKDIGYNIYFLHFNDGDKARTYYTKALGIINEDESLHIEDISESLDLFRLIANVFSQKGQYDSTYHYFQLAFDQINPGIDETVILHSSQEKIAQFKKIHYLTSLVIDKADAYRQQYETTKQTKALQEAIRIYKIADQFLDKIKDGQSDLQSKLFWRSDSRRLYENAIKACYLQGNTTDAFYFFEKSRAVLLNDQLNEQQWMGEKEILKQAQLKKDILNLERGLAGEKSSGANYAAFQSQIFSAKHELDRLEQSIKAKNPLYYQNFLDTGFISLSYAQKNLLNQNQALLEIFSGDSAVYVLLITARHSFLKKIDKRDYENTVSEYISYISNSSLLNRDFAGYIKIASHLYSLIFKEKLIPGQRIIISPDGQYFPFESLVSTNAIQSPGYLINDHAVSYTYSARFLMNDFKSAPGNGRNFMGVAPINYPASFSLASLPGSDQSLQRIENYFRYSAKQVAINASRNNFLRQFSGYKIIQLYTHAADSSVNNEPVIYFADSALYLSDLIHESKPVTRLIVLSACETGRGKLYNGEGVFSFNRGFAALGIPSAITNLWAVDNESTYKLTELFYKFLSKGLPTDVALQKAKLEFLKNASGEKSLPFYWAAPVLVGKSDAIRLEKTQPWKWIVLLTGVGCIVFFAARKWISSKKAA